MITVTTSNHGTLVARAAIVAYSSIRGWRARRIEANIQCLPKGFAHFSIELNAWNNFDDSNRMQVG
jgi:hypothetical protein